MTNKNKIIFSGFYILPDEYPYVEQINGVIYHGYWVNGYYYKKDGILYIVSGSTVYEVLPDTIECEVYTHDGYTGKEKNYILKNIE